MWAGLGMAIALAAITAGGIVISQDDAPAAGTANFHTVASGAGSCTRSATPIDYATANSNGWTCSSMDAAYQAASCGDSVIMKGGSYGAQTINWRSALASCGSQISYTVASGETVALTGELNFCGARHISVVSPSVSQFTSQAALVIHPCGSSSTQPADVTVSYINFGGDGVNGNYYIDSLSGGTISHNDFGPNLVGPGEESKFWCNTSGTTINNNIVFEYNYIHDITSDGSSHNSGGLVSYLHDSILRGNKFARVVSEDWLVKPDGSGQASCNTDGDQIKNLTIENNWFAAPCASGCGSGPDHGLSFHNRDGNPPGTAGDPFQSFIIRNNSLNSVITFNNSDSTVFDSASRFYGNVLPKGGECMVGGTTEYNMYFGSSGATCGTNAATQTGNPFANSSDSPGVFDYHLGGADGSTAADDLVPTSITGGCPAKDIDEQTRPIDTNCDAGSDER